MNKTDSNKHLSRWREAVARPALRAVMAVATLTLVTCAGSGSTSTLTPEGPTSTSTPTPTPTPSPTPTPTPAPAPAQACTPIPASSLSGNVKTDYGAKGDGISNDTSAIQKGINAMAGTGGSLVFPGGTYRVTANNVLIRSNLTLQLGDAVIQVIPNAQSDYNVLTMIDASNVNIIGGTLAGDFGSPATHLGSLGEGGVGLNVSGAGCQNIMVAGTVARDCMGDGFYVGGPVGVAGPSHVTFCSVQASHNRRSGLTITHGGNLVIRDSSFTGNGGTMPECGINIEPNLNQHVDQVLITGCRFSGNAGDGIADGVPLIHAGTDTTITNVTIDGNTVTANGANSQYLPAYPQRGIEISNTSGHVISNNIVSDNYAYGILWRDGATGLTITGNTVTGNHWAGLTGASSGNTISGNTVTGNGP